MDDVGSHGPSSRDEISLYRETANGSTLSFTARIAGWSARHRWLVLTASAAFIFLAVVAMIAIGTDFRDDDEGVGESGKAVKLMDERFRDEPLPSEQLTAIRSERLIFSNPSREVDDPVFRSTVERTVDELRALRLVTSVVSYYDTQDPDMVSADRHAVLGQITLQDESLRHGRDIDIRPVLDKVDSAQNEASGFEIGVVSFALIDEQFEEIIDEDFSRIMLISLGLGLIILLLAFRAVVAAVIPLVMAIGAIFSALGLATLVSKAYPLVDCWQSAQVGQIRTREGYYYEELRGSSLRVLL